jgi:hypothetical protein
LLSPPKYLDLIGVEAPILAFANLLLKDKVSLIVRRGVSEEPKLSMTAWRGLIQPSPVLSQVEVRNRR